METVNENIKQPPVSVGDWVVTYLITLVPIVGFVMLFVWAFGGNAKASKANWAKAALLLFAIGVGLTFLISVIFGVGLFSMLNDSNAVRY